jgi:hypothetical protein
MTTISQSYLGIESDKYYSLCNGVKLLRILKRIGRKGRKNAAFSFDCKIRTDFAGWSILRPPAQVGPILFKYKIVN